MISTLFVFAVREGGGDGLPENSATAIVQTPDGYLWFGTFNGLVRFNGVQFTVFNPDNTPQLPDADIVNLHLDKGGRLWVSTYRGLVVYADGQWRQLTRIEVESGDYARTFAERILPLVALGRLAAHVDRFFPLAAFLLLFYYLYQKI